MVAEEIAVTRRYVGAPGGIRTPNLLIRSQMLYPLSYGRLFSFVVPPPGREPPTDHPVASAEAEGFEPSVPLTSTTH